MNHRQIAERMIGSMTNVSSPAVSPDGRRIAFVRTVVNLDDNRYESQIWMVDADGTHAPRALTNGIRAAAPVWSPDGRTLAFVSGRGEKDHQSTLHLLAVDGPGETLTVATMDDGIAEARFSPDGRWLAFLSRTRDPRYSEDERRQPPRKIERFFTQLNGQGWVFDRPQHVYLVPADGSAKPRNLTPGPWEHSGLDWAPDSASLVVAGQRHETWDTDLANGLYRVTLRGRVSTILEPHASVGHPVVSPSGASIAVHGSDDPAVSPKNVHVAVLSRTGRGLRWVSTGLDRTFLPYPGGRACIWEGEDSLLSAVEDRGHVHLYRVFADASAPEALTEGAFTVSGFDAAGGTIALTRGTVDEVGDVFVLEHGSLRRLTDFSARCADECDPLGWERLEVPCADGSDVIDAWVMRPARMDPKGSYPVLLNVHGGPFTQYGERFFDEAQMQAAAGFVVVMCNPRGSSGREEAWGQAINGPAHPSAPGTGWGTKDADDVNTVIDHVLRTVRGADRRRVGMLGGSYGGYMATWLATTTGKKFAAICSERAVNNMLSEEWTADISTAFRTEIGPNHVTDPSEYVRMSPINRVAEVSTPMLLIHSEQDLRCPISQAEELFVALRLLGKEVTFYRFPAENHELSRSGSPVHRVQRAEIILDWFSERLAAPRGRTAKRR